ncbi:hypothetical protein NKR23_g1994 [Pleurostoma richardsiae]|uniref:Glutamyl-tRNA(Gln) amidotransferase subunit A, mitochondrial n=1 Tax=Pleurostoma richardsiae TaxID=41990 RepID=A0AA38SBS2_9PEZI|nr:hypothetical protein NKR23_g1994 [Pleurostoma richardsiae]
MSFNARLSSLRLRPRHANLLSRCDGWKAQRRGLNEFITRVPEPTGPQDLPSTFRLAVKDNIATLSTPTTCASDILAGYTSPFEATVVSQLRARGASVVGKTNLDEFGMGSHSTNSAAGPVRHTPPDLAPFSVGGSSGGSAVAISEGAADLALGTDTGGSVRLPAAYCGVVGFKPSYGMISRFGVVPYANSLDTVGFLAQTVRPIWEQVAARGGLWSEHDPRDPTSLSAPARKRCAAARQFYDREDLPGADQFQQTLRSLTFGIPIEYNIAELDAPTRTAWARAASRLEALGARVVPVSLPSTRHALSAYYVIAPAEASSNLAKYDGVRYGRRAGDASTSDGAGGVLYAGTRGEGFGAEVRRRVLLGSYTLSSEAMGNYFIRAQRVRRLVARDFDRAFRLANPLRGSSSSSSSGEGPEEGQEQEQEQFDLSEMDEGVALESKLGPPQVDFLLCPTAPTAPPRLDEVMGQGSPLDSYMNDVFTVPASLAGLPAVSIPVRLDGGAGAGEGEKKVGGLQLVAQYWDDARLLAVAHGLFEDPEV